MKYVAIVVLAGCFSKPPPPAGDGDDDPDAPGPPPCVAGPIADTFDEPAASPCGQGFEDQNASSTIERSGGVLRASPGANVVNDASCSWPPVDFSTGAFVQVHRPLRTGGSYTILQLASGVGIEVLDETAPILAMFDSAQTSGALIAMLPYDQNEMQWWRLRPDAGAITAEYSADGRAWTVLGTTTTTPAPTGAVSVSLNAGIYNPLADPGAAEFDNFNVCP